MPDRAIAGTAIAATVYLFPLSPVRRGRRCAPDLRIPFARATSIRIAGTSGSVNDRWFTSPRSDTKGARDVQHRQDYYHPETDPHSRGGQGRAGLTDTPTKPCGERGAGLLTKPGPAPPL